MCYNILTHIKHKNHMIILIETEKSFDKIQLQFIIKTLQN